MATSDSLKNYLEEVTGQRVDLAPESSGKLPLFLRDRFQIRTALLFGRRYLLALESEGHDPYSPGEYETRATMLENHLGRPVVLVLPVLESYARNRLVRKNIAFIVPGSQMFLPTALIDLRERQPSLRPVKSGRLTPAAQCLVLYHLQRSTLSGTALQDVARKIGYSPVMLTKVRSELENAGLCEPARQGRTIWLRFLLHGKKLWEHALPLLSAPNRKRLWVLWQRPGHPALLAGVSALSRLTLLQDDELPTYAMWRRSFRPLIEQGTLHQCRAREEANLCLETWAYDPLVLSAGDTVDPLSLFLSMRDSPDERIQQQLRILMEGSQWLKD